MTEYKLDQARAGRQAVLDILNASTYRMRPCDIGKKLGLVARQLCSRLARMVELGEIDRAEGGYRALTTTTKYCKPSGRMTEKAERAAEKVASAKIPRLPGARTVHFCSDKESQPAARLSRRSNPGRGYSPIMEQN